MVDEDVRCTLKIVSRENQGSKDLPKELGPCEVVVRISKGFLGFDLDLRNLFGGRLKLKGVKRASDLTHIVAGKNGSEEPHVLLCLGLDSVMVFLPIGGDGTGVEGNRTRDGLFGPFNVFVFGKIWTPLFSVDELG